MRTHKNHTHLKLLHVHPLASQKLRENERMNLLYESETFAVMHMLANAPIETSVPSGQPQLERHGFEIVDKRSGKEVYLDGSWAEMFQQQIQAWQQHTPTQEEVEDTLEGYTGLAQQPVVVH
jgi:hypothetical protein